MPEVVLPGGRVLAYREYGEPSGRPVICNHGGLMCGQDISPADAAARDLHLRLISPDRPGIGSSTLKRGRITADWAHDVDNLADALGLDAFGAFGWSLGGQYALALGVLLPRRTSAVVVVAGCLPGLAPEQMNPTDRRFMRVSQASAPAAAAMFGIVRTVAQLAPRVVRDATMRTVCPADREVLAALPDSALGQWMAAATTRPSGMVEEYRVLGRPWGFDLSGMRAPTTYWQGGMDTLVPAQWADRLGAMTPGATVRTVPGDGHFLAYSRWHEVLGAFAAR